MKRFLIIALAVNLVSCQAMKDVGTMAAVGIVMGPYMLLNMMEPKTPEEKAAKKAEKERQKQLKSKP